MLILCQQDLSINQAIGDEKCDGHKQTLTLILTEFDKIIGGYTPLPWKTGGGEWYEDKNGKSFLFNLSSG